MPEPAQPERVLLSLIEGWQQLAAIVEGSDTAIIGKSLDGTIRTWNPGAERLYGYGAAEVIGRPISMLAPADRRDEIPEILDRVARGERVERLETVRRARDGRLVEVSLSVSPIRDLSGRITGASTIAHDISPRRRAVALERANEAMRMFVATASHDLRTPLATALGFAELLQQQGAELSGQDRAECLGAVLRSIRQATRLVEDLLTLSKIQAGRVEVRPDRVVLRPAIAAAVEECAPGAMVTCHDGIAAWVDPDHLHRMLANYLSNAVRHGAPPVEVSDAVVGQRVEILVSDAGEGVPPEFVDRLFSAFARAARVKSDGTGLGLSIVKGLAEANHGEVFYQPRPTGGSCFGLRLERHSS